MAAVRLTAPKTSNLRTVCCRLSPAGTRRVAATRVTSATTTGRKNTYRQPIWVKTPPNTKPAEKPVAPVAV
jgi:hypothetical protein